jgi:hypothetical protein
VAGVRRPLGVDEPGDHRAADGFEQRAAGATARTQAARPASKSTVSASSGSTRREVAASVEKVALPRVKGVDPRARR